MATYANVSTTDAVCQLDFASILTGAIELLKSAGNTEAAQMLAFCQERRDEIAQQTEQLLEARHARVALMASIADSVTANGRRRLAA